MRNSATDERNHLRAAVIQLDYLEGEMGETPEATPEGVFSRKSEASELAMLAARRGKESTPRTANVVTRAPEARHYLSGIENLEFTGNLHALLTDLVEGVIGTNLRLTQELMSMEAPRAFLELQQRFYFEYLNALQQGIAAITRAISPPPWNGCSPIYSPAE
jgi:hypothetical protein